MRRAEANKRRLNNLSINGLKPRAQPFAVWDTMQPGLCVIVQPSGVKNFYVVYRAHGRPRWFRVGRVDAFGLADARKLAKRVMFQVAEGKDPQAERRAERNKGSFEDLYQRYLEYAKRKNRSWALSDRLVRKHVLPRFGKLQAAKITRTDVKAMLAKLIDTPAQSNLVLANTSAIFAWAVKEELVPSNLCTGIERHNLTSRERVLSDTELPLFWRAFDDAGLYGSTALKLILLLGQRPGEVVHMHRAHISDNWWEMPGKPVPELSWPGTKNGMNHRVWLPKPARDLLAVLDDDESGPVFPHVSRLSDSLIAICKKLKVREKLTPHDLRRSHGTMITRLGFGRDGLNRIQNHKDGGIASVYDRHSYTDETKEIMESVAAEIMALIEGTPDNVIKGRFKKRS